MNKFKWKSPIVLGLAAFSLFSTGTLLITSQASAARVPEQITNNQKLTTDAQNRNVTFTGTTALYTKPSVKKGAQEVISKVALKELAKSDSSADNFVAYRQATTKNGQVYYKIVSFDGQYRGWIYGGKHVGKFAGGLEKFTAFKEIPLPSNLAKYTFNIAAPGMNNDGKSVTYTEPMNTVYGAGRTVGDAVAYKNAAFKIDKMGTRTREGDTWVHVTSVDQTAAKLNGWILYKGLSQAEDPLSGTAVRIDLVNSSGQLIKYIDYQKPNAQSGKTLGLSYSDDGTEVWLLGASDQQKLQDNIRDALKGTGYSLETLSANQTGYLAEATVGGKTSLTAAQADSIPNDAVQINIINQTDGVIGSFNYTKPGASAGQSLAATDNGTTGLSSDDQNAIQADIKTALKSTGYSLNALSSSQLEQLANAQFGNSVYLKTTTKTTDISDNAVRINFVDPSTKKIVTSIDYTNTDADDPAPKGSDLGVQSGNNWTLKSEDNTAITNEAITTLDGTGYSLTDNKLSDADLATIGAAKFGSSVSINVSADNAQATTNQSSTH